jgi:hypothetical protein
MKKSNISIPTVIRSASTAINKVNGKKKEKDSPASVVFFQHIPILNQSIDISDEARLL